MTLKQGSAPGDIDSIPWLLAWEHGSAQVQPLGAMLGPVRLRLGDKHALEVMHVAPWADAPGAAGLPGVMRRLRGEWPCLPFGRVDYPRGLPDGWTRKEPGDHWNHGYSANHPWHCVESSGTHLHLAIDYPADSPILRMERMVKADPHAPALDISLTVWVRRPTQLPAGLHPTFRLPSVPGRVQVLLGEHQGIHSYPTNGDAGLSRLHPDTRSDTLGHMAGTHGTLDFTRLPLAGPTEDLVQVRGLRGASTGQGMGAPFALH